MQIHIDAVINAFIYALLGIFLFCGSFALLDKLTPYALWQEIVEKQNTALAILVGCMSIGMCVIIAAAVH
ncbi:MAG: DUF350 domain-containing protein [Bryobacteraceae bacterium]